MAKQRLSDEIIGMKILRYLVQRRENNEGACTAHHLSKIRDIHKSQRQQRIEDILNLFCKGEYVRSYITSAGTMYEITETGIEFFKGSGRPVLELWEGYYK
jgi:hypothetical protein